MNDSVGKTITLHELLVQLHEARVPGLDEDGPGYQGVKLSRADWTELGRPLAVTYHFDDQDFAMWVKPSSGVRRGRAVFIEAEKAGT